MIETDANRHNQGLSSLGRPVSQSSLSGGLAIGKVTKGVATALGKTLAVDREADLPDQLASLVERLQAGPLGQTQLKSRRVA